MPTFPNHIYTNVSSNFGSHVWREETGLSRADFSENDLKLSPFITGLKPEAAHCRLYESNLMLISSQWTNTFWVYRNIRIHSLWSQACTCTCRILVCSGSLRGGCTCGCLSHTRHGLEAQEANCTCSNTQFFLLMTSPPMTSYILPTQSYLPSTYFRS